MLRNSLARLSEESRGKALLDSAKRVRLVDSNVCFKVQTSSDSHEPRNSRVSPIDLLNTNYVSSYYHKVTNSRVIGNGLLHSRNPNF